MNLSNEEIVCATEDAIDTIQLAIQELEGLDGFEYIINNLEEDIEEIKKQVQPYKELYEDECRQELAYERGR